MLLFQAPPWGELTSLGGNSIVQLKESIPTQARRRYLRLVFPTVQRALQGLTVLLENPRTGRDCRW